MPIRIFRGSKSPKLRSGVLLGRVSSGTGDAEVLNLSDLLRNPRLAALATSSGTSFANPTATAGPNAINGSAPTAMRSDAAPAVQLGTTGQPGLVQPDGTTITVNGSGVIKAPGLTASFQPGYVSGRWYYPPYMTSNPGTVALNNNTVYACPFYVSTTHTFQAIGLYTSGTSSGKFMELGIYNNSGGAPSSLLLDAGEVSVGTAGGLNIAISQSLGPGWYWLACAVNPSGGLAVFGGNQPFGAFMEGNASFSNAAEGQAATVAWAYSTGNLPNPFGTVTWVNGTQLLFALEG